MKKKFRFLLLPGMVALSFLYLAFQTSSLPYPIFTLITGLANGATPAHIKVSSIQGLQTPLTQTTSQSPYWKVFFSLGDGRFWMGTLNDLADQKFFYNTALKPPTQDAFVETTAAYDDTVNPQRSSSFTPGAPTGTTIPAGEELAVGMATHGFLIKKAKYPSDVSLSLFLR